MKKLYYFLSLIWYAPLAYATIFYSLDNSNYNSLIIFWVYFVIAIIFYIFSKILKNDSIKKELNSISKFLFVYLVALIPFFISLYFYDEKATNAVFRFFWKTSFLYVTLALLISPLISIFKIEKFREYFLLSRKIFWILAFFLFFRHWFDYFALEIQYYSYQDPTKITLMWYIIKNIEERVDVIIWLIAGLIIFLLWITSNKFSESILWWKVWKWLHNLIYIWFVITLVHIAFTSRFDMYYLFLFVILVLFRYIDFLKNSKVKSWTTTKYICLVCWYIYDEKLWDIDWWLPPGTKFEDIPDDWTCPVCSVSKKDFVPYYDDDSKNKENSIETEIISYKMLTSDILELEIKTSKVLTSKPWQYISFLLKDYDWSFKRSYSIVEKNDSTFKFCIKLKVDGRGAKVLKKLKVWDKVEIVWVFWDFVLKDTTNQKVFIATWTWLAPIMNMIKNDNISKKALLFWVPFKQDIIYEKELKEIPGLSCKIYLSKEQVEWYENWRIDLSKFNFSFETEFYICWNPMMVKENVDYLTSKWYKNVFFEKFI